MTPKYDLSAIKNAIPQKRLAHSLGVELTALQLAEKHCPNLYTQNTISAAALLHDITKYIEPEEQLKLCKKYGIKLTPVERNDYHLFHQLTGAETARELFGVDELIYEAIKCHTTGKPAMNKLEKILLLADYIEPNRSYPGCEKLREIYKAYDFKNDKYTVEKSIIYALGMTVSEVMEREGLLHPLTIEARNYLILEQKAV